MDHSNSRFSAQQSYSTGPPIDPYKNPSAFTHAPLKHPRHFRILHLEGSSRWKSRDWKDQILHGTLVETSLDTVPRYLALSYVWGDPSPSDVIFIDKQPLKITQSCGAGLRRMLKGKSEIKIWVDAICINQAGDTQAVQERSTQVAFMDEIYSKAVQVNVHLGEGDENTDEAIKAAKRLAAACTAALQAKRVGVRKGITKRRYDQTVEQVLRKSQEYPYGRLYPLFRLPWFGRVWVFQEVVLAQKVVFHCGEHSISFEDLDGAADFTRVPYSKLDLKALYWSSYLGGHTECIRRLRLEDHGEYAELCGDLLTIVAKLDATRHEDKIYGMYGYAKRMKLDWPVPDYTKSVAEIYTEATVACFRHTKGLVVMLMAIGPASGDLGLPSWVPNFSGHSRARSLSEPPEIGLGIPENKHCTGGTHCDWNFMPDRRRLRVKGRRFDCIAAVSVPWKYGHATTLRGGTESNLVKASQGLLDCIGSWFQVVLQRSRIRNRNTSVAHHLEAVSDLARLFTNGHFAPTKPPDRFAESLSLLTNSTRENDVALRASLIIPENGEGVIRFTQPLQQAFEYISLFAWELVFRTTEKSCLGIGNRNAKAGDLLIVFHGMETPCLVRPCAGGFTFIGATFVDGIMNGEFWERGSDKDDEWFTLI